MAAVLVSLMCRSWRQSQWSRRSTGRSCVFRVWKWRLLLLFPGTSMKTGQLWCVMIPRQCPSWAQGGVAGVNAPDLTAGSLPGWWREHLPLIPPRCEQPLGEGDRHAGAVFMGGKKMWSDWLVSPWLRLSPGLTGLEKMRKVRQMRRVCAGVADQAERLDYWELQKVTGNHGICILFVIILDVCCSLIIYYWQFLVTWTWFIVRYMSI